ncbi:hypothetical protein BKA64DRAFT_646281 [Cadophora sp. MPI-SDFR-AT-0126]|nr:hypothetical protein BKA64DRAFT_646281 [Leotiomycetes sp. MPI-SDFR-AT-0126]
MSNMGNSDLDSPMAHSVEQDNNASPTKDNRVAMAKANSIPEHGHDDTSAGHETNSHPEADTIEANSNGVLCNPVNLSHPFSRSCSPTEQQNYETFRSPINDSRGYYANALRRRELGSASPPPSLQRRVAPRLNDTSPPYLPKSVHDDSSTRAHRASPGPPNGREYDDDEMDEDSPPRCAPPQSPYDNVGSGTPRRPAGYGGRTIRRESFGEINQQEQPDPYVGVDPSMESFDDGSEIYNHVLGGREPYPSPSQLVQDVYRPGSHGPDVRNVGHFDKHGENSFRQRRQRGESRFYHPSQHSRGDFNRCHIIPPDAFRQPSEHDETDSSQPQLKRFDVLHGPGEPLTNGEDELLFVQEYSPTASTSKKQEGTGIGSRGVRPYKRLFSHETYVNGAPLRASIPVAAGKKRKFAEEFEDGGRFNQPGAVLDPSRYSGDPSINWGLNQDPPSIPQIAVSDAALLKRGLTRGAKEKVCKRGYGANDPENVNIVNMKEDGMSFAEIVEVLNETRVANGRAPSLSVCGVTSRYNRTAPLLFAAEGKQFIPLSKRGKGQVLADGPLYEKPVWNDQLDLVLAQVVKDVDKDKWNRVAMEYNRRTGKNISAQSAALRHTIL